MKKLLFVQAEVFLSYHSGQAKFKTKVSFLSWLGNKTKRSLVHAKLQPFGYSWECISPEVVEGYRNRRGSPPLFEPSHHYKAKGLLGNLAFWVMEDVYQ